MWPSLKRGPCIFFSSKGRSYFKLKTIHICSKLSSSEITPPDSFFNCSLRLIKAGGTKIFYRIFSPRRLERFGPFRTSTSLRWRLCNFRNILVGGQRTYFLLQTIHICAKTFVISHNDCHIHYELIESA
jgi:hypothetical protein